MEALNIIARLGQRCSRNNLKASHNAVGRDVDAVEVGTKVFKEQSESKSQHLGGVTLPFFCWDKGVQGTI